MDETALECCSSSNLELCKRSNGDLISYLKTSSVFLDIDEDYQIAYSDYDWGLNS